jgi:hypothetical protein
VVIVVGIVGIEAAVDVTVATEPDQGWSRDRHRQ